MNPEEPSAVEEQVTAWLAACDDALAAGEALPDPGPLADQPGWQEKLGRNLDCMRLLRGELPPRPPADKPPEFLDAGLYAGQPLATVGRFRLRREIGRGGFGIVYLADDSLLGRPVALKVPRPEALINPDLRQRFLREAQAAARLEHPNLVPVYDAGEAGPICYIASAYCPGPNLAEWLKQHPGPVPPRAAASLLAALAEGVEHAHRHGILHRDLKPSNILLQANSADRPQKTEGTGPRNSSDLCLATADFSPKITDFGLAKLLDAEDEQTASGVLLGTPPYMAPEQAEGRLSAVGPATDVYALGVILYELLTRRLPCRGPSLLVTLEQVRSQEPVRPRRLEPGVPRDLEIICLKCLHKDPRDRYASARDLAEDLRRFLGDESIKAWPLGLFSRAWRWCRRPERIRDASLMALLNGLVAGGVSLIGVLAVVTGKVPIDRPLAAIAFQFTIILGDGLPLVWIGRNAARRKRFALWAGFAMPLVFLTFLTGAVLGAFDIGGLVNENDLAMRQAEYFTVVFLNGVQLVLFTFALLAYHANRDVPGFLPEQPVGSDAR